MSNIPKARKKKWFKKWWVWVIAAVVLLIIIAIPAARSSMQNAQIEKYAYLEDSIEVAERSFEKTVSATGTVQAEESQELFASAPSRVTEVNFAVGDEVNKDDVIVKSDAEEFSAPFDGRVLAINTFVDGTTGLTTPVVEVGFRSSVVEFYASDAEVIDLEEGQEVHFTVSSYENGNDEYDGEVVFVDTQKTLPQVTLGDDTSGYLVRMSTGELPEEVANVIGIAVDVEIVVGEVTNTLSVPSGAVQTDEDGEEFVYIAPTVDSAFAERAESADDLTDVLRREDIETGFAGDEYTEVLDGVDEDDDVILYVAPRESNSLF